MIPAAAQRDWRTTLKTFRIDGASVGDEERAAHSFGDHKGDAPPEAAMESVPEMRPPFSTSPSSGNGRSTVAAPAVPLLNLGPESLGVETRPGPRVRLPAAAEEGSHPAIPQRPKYAIKPMAPIEITGLDAAPPAAGPATWPQEVAISAPLPSPQLNFTHSPGLSPWSSTSGAWSQAAPGTPPPQRGHVAAAARPTGGVVGRLGAAPLARAGPAVGRAEAAGDGVRGGGAGVAKLVSSEPGPRLPSRRGRRVSRLEQSDCELAFVPSQNDAYDRTSLFTLFHAAGPLLREALLSPWRSPLSSCCLLRISRPYGSTACDRCLARCMWRGW